jgi:hypothetical protein
LNQIENANLVRDLSSHDLPSRLSVNDAADYRDCFRANRAFRRPANAEHSRFKEQKHFSIAHSSSSFVASNI